MTVIAFGVFVVDALTNRTIEPVWRVVWVVLMIFANVAAFPIYWYVVHWRRPVAVSASE